MSSPPSPPPPDLNVLRNSYGAALVASVTYGFYVAIAMLTAHALIVRPRGSGHKLNTRLALVYVGFMFAVQTIYYVAGSKWSEIEFVETIGDNAAFATQLSNNLSILKNTMYTVNLWLSDGFIVWRSFVVYGGRFAPATVPAVLYLGSIATGIGLLVESAKPGAAFGQVKIINFGTPFWSLSVATNVVATVLIATRLLYRKGDLRRFTSRYAGKSVWASEVAILAESALVYAIVAIIYIPLFARNSPVQFPFSSLLVTTSCIATNVIIFRMAKGVAITRDWTDMELPIRTPGSALAAAPADTASRHSQSTTHKDPMAP